MWSVTAPYGTVPRVRGSGLSRFGPRPRPSAAATSAMAACPAMGHLSGRCDGRDRWRRSSGSDPRPAAVGSGSRGLPRSGGRARQWPSSRPGKGESRLFRPIKQITTVQAAERHAADQMMAGGQLMTTGASSPSLGLGENVRCALGGADRGDASAWRTGRGRPVEPALPRRLPPAQQDPPAACQPSRIPPPVTESNYRLPGTGRFATRPGAGPATCRPGA
jgi:hypothetical protein